MNTNGFESAQSPAPAPAPATPLPPKIGKYYYPLPDYMRPLSGIMLYNWAEVITTRFT